MGTPLKVVLAVVVCAIFLSWAIPPAGAGDPPDQVRIGIAGSLVQDSPALVVGALLQPFGALVQAQTGLMAEMVRGKDYCQLGRQVQSDALHLGVFQGVEFAWVRQLHQDLRPLVVAVNQKLRPRAFLVVRGDSPAAGFADLRGKSLDLPRHSRLHSRLFLENGCRQAAGLSAERFFTHFGTTANAEDALDDLVDGSGDALVVNEVAFDSYQRRKPARCTRLKIIQRSQCFPPTVIAYHPGAMKPDKLQQLRDGLLNANQSALGKQLMSFWRLTGFEAVPPDLDQLAAAISKAYPPPDLGGVVEQPAGRVSAGK
jgi:ABC-type phosphate/phosphonate transport system substrate-binding protein